MAISKFVRFSDTHRLIPAELSGKDSELATLSVSPETRTLLDQIDAATDDRKRAEARGDEYLGPHELLYGIPYSHIVNAAFSYPGPYGGRFNTPDRGAWYACIELRTSFAEVAFHKRRFLENGEIPDPIPFDYVDFLADIDGNLHHLTAREERKYLKPGPIPQCYWASQRFAESLLYAGSNGIVYPSVRRRSGRCVACFRPALVTRVRRAKMYRLTIRAGESKYQTHTVGAR